MILSIRDNNSHCRVYVDAGDKEREVFFAIRESLAYMRNKTLDYERLPERRRAEVFFAAMEHAKVKLVNVSEYTL